MKLVDSLPRRGPGSVASTQRALHLLGQLPPRPRIIELCGSSPATADLLASTTGGTVTVVRPCCRTQRSAAASSADDRRALPQIEPVFDLVWCEGGVCTTGLRDRLARWRHLVRPGGFLAVAESAWLDSSPPEESVAFWSATYPAMATHEANLASLAATGWQILDYFILPASDWRDHFGALEAAVGQLLCQRPGDRDAAELAAESEAEISLWRRQGKSYGYVFYVARRD